MDKRTEVGLDGEPFEVVMGWQRLPKQPNSDRVAPVVNPTTIKFMPEKKDGQQASLYAIETVDFLISFLEDIIRKGATVGWDRANDKPLDKFIEIEGNHFKHDILGARKLSPEDRRVVAYLFKEKAKTNGRQQEIAKNLLLRHIFPV